MKHIHAELMVEYAKDAMKTDRPWERWEYCSCSTNQEWESCVSNPSWSSNVSYRKKPEKIIVNGYELCPPCHPCDASYSFNVMSKEIKEWDGYKNRQCANTILFKTRKDAELWNHALFVSE